MTDRRRNLFVLLLVAGLLVASLAVIVTKPTRLGLDLKGGVSLIYQGKPLVRAEQDDPKGKPSNLWYVLKDQTVPGFSFRMTSPNALRDLRIALLRVH